jgi:hypothetical protein
LSISSFFFHHHLGFCKPNKNLSGNCYRASLSNPLCNSICIAVLQSVFGDFSIALVLVSSGQKNDVAGN